MFPYPRILPHRPVTATWHITEYSVEKKLVLPLRRNARFGVRREDRLFRGNFDGREDRGVQIRDHERRGGKSCRLVDEKVRPLVVTVVRDQQSGWDR